MRPFVKQLEDANLVHSTIDESDQSRRTIVVTANGWLVHYKRDRATRREAEILCPIVATLLRQHVARSRAASR